MPHYIVLLIFFKVLIWSTFFPWFRSFIIQKLFSLVDQTSLPDNPDSMQNQEILVPGHLITIYLKVHNYFTHVLETSSMWLGCVVFTRVCSSNRVTWHHLHWFYRKNWKSGFGNAKVLLKRRCVILRANLTLKIVSCFRFVPLFNVLVSCIRCNYMKLNFFGYIPI